MTSRASASVSDTGGEVGQPVHVHDRCPLIVCTLEPVQPSGHSPNVPPQQPLLQISWVDSQVLLAWHSASVWRPQIRSEVAGWDASKFGHAELHWGSPLQAQ